MAISILKVAYLGDSTGWSAAAASLLAGAKEKDDGAYCYASVAGSVLSFLFPTTSVGTGNLITGVRLVVRAKGTAAGAKIKWAVRHGSTTSTRLSELPRGEAIDLTTDYQEFSITFVNQPAFTIQGRDKAWSNDGSDFNDFLFGVSVDTIASGNVYVDQVRLEVLYRSDVELADILASGRAQTFQWAEIEGIPWVPCTHQLGAIADDWTVGAYYWGLDARPLGGLLSSNEAFRSGQVDHAKGRVEFESARLQLLDTTQVAYEHDPNTDEPLTQVFPKGFFSWLLAYGDKASIGRTYLTDSTSLSYNTIKGLDPKDWSGSYGRIFTVADGSVLPAGGGDDDFCYIGREALYIGTRSGNTVGGTGNTDLERGLFGSLNGPHEVNHISGVYPEVTDHPVSWGGRWVRVWLNAIDPATGLPLPMSKAVARTYVWGTFDQRSGPGHVGFTVSLRSFESLLDQPIPDGLKDARIKGLNLAAFGLFYEQYASGGVYVAPEQISYPDTGAGETSKYFDTLADLCSEITSETASATSNYIQLKVSPAQGNVIIYGRIGTDHQVRLYFSPSAAQILGFEPGGPHMPANDSAINSNYTNKWQRFEASSPAATAFADRWCKKIYVVDKDTDDWPSITAAKPSAKLRIMALVGVGNEEPFLAEYLGISNDSDGDYVVLWAINAVPSVAAFLKKQSNVYATAGDAQPRIRPILVAEAVQPHEFFLPLLLSTGYGVNGDYDILPKGFGLGIREDLIDAAGIAAASYAIPGNLRTYVLPEPVSVSELLEEETSWPTGLLQQQDSSGRLTWSFAAIPSTSDTVTAVDDDDVQLGSVAVLRHRADGILNVIKTEIDVNPFTGKSRTSLQAVETNSIRRYGAHERKVRHRGIHTGILGSAISTQDSPFSLFQMLARILFERLAWERPQVDVELGVRALVLQPGDGLELSLSSAMDINDRAAGELDEVACEVLKVNKNDVTGQCAVTLIYDLERKNGGWAPAAKVASWASATKTLTLEAHAFSDSSGTTVDADYFSEGDKILLFEGDDESPTVNHLEVASVSGNDLVLTTSPTFTPAAGDLIRWEKYDTLTSSQQGKGYVQVANTSGKIDSADSVDGWTYAP